MSLRNQPHFVGGNFPWKLWVRLKEYVETRRTTVIEVVRAAVAFYLDAQERPAEVIEVRLPGDFDKAFVTGSYMRGTSFAPPRAIAEVIANGFDSQRQGTE